MRFTVAVLILLLNIPAFAEDPIPMPDPALPPPTDTTTAAPEAVSPAAEETAVEEATPPAETPTEEAALPAATSEEDLIGKRIAEERRENEIRSAKERRNMYYHEGGRKHIGIEFAFKAFDDFDFDPTVGVTNLSTSGLVLQFMYFPIIQGIGRVGFGPVLGLYRTSGDQTYDGLSPSFATGGIEAQYAAQWSVGQLIVPFASLGGEHVNTFSYNKKTSATTSERVKPSGFDRGYFVAGFEFNLNRVEQRVATQSLVDTGIRKFYFVASWKVPLDKGKDGNALLGLRLEF